MKKILHAISSQSRSPTFLSSQSSQPSSNVASLPTTRRSEGKQPTKAPSDSGAGRDAASPSRPRSPPPSADEEAAPAQSRLETKRPTKAPRDSDRHNNGRHGRSSGGHNEHRDRSLSLIAMEAVPAVNPHGQSHQKKKVPKPQSRVVRARKKLAV